MELLSLIPFISIEGVPRAKNDKADALAKITKNLANPNQEVLLILIQNRRILASFGGEEASIDPQTKSTYVIKELKDWKEPFIHYFKER